MDPNKTKIYRSLLPGDGKKLLLNKTEEEPELIYRRFDVKKGSQAKRKTLSMSAAAVRKRISRQKIVNVDGKETTNRALERVRDKEWKRFKRMLDKNVGIKVNRQRKTETPKTLPDVNALTEYNRTGRAVGEYRIRKRRRYIIEDEYEHSTSE